MEGDIKKQKFLRAVLLIRKRRQKLFPYLLHKHNCDHMLSDLFYTVDFALCILISSIGFVAGTSMMLIVLFNRRCQTILNLLKCNTIFTMMVYSLLVLISSILGMNKQWSQAQPGCAVRAFCFNTICGVVCYSFAVQAISRLFHAVFYQRKFLLTWKAHWYLIIFSWLICILFEFLMYMISNDILTYEEASRWCLISTQKPILSLCSIIIAMFTPMTIMLVVYSIILYRVRQSTRRVQAFAAQNIAITLSPIATPLNAKREIKVMKNMTLIMSLMFCSGILYIILLVWNLGGWSSPPESLYLISLNAMALGVTILIVLTLWTNKEVRTVIAHHVRSYRERNRP